MCIEKHKKYTMSDLFFFIQCDLAEQFQNRFVHAIKGEHQSIVCSLPEHYFYENINAEDTDDKCNAFA